MKHIFVIALFSILCSSLSAQKNKKQDDDEGYVTFTKIEINASTDTRAWTSYVKKAAILPDSVEANILPGRYKVDVEFIVDKYGNLGEVKARNNPGYGLARRAEKIISNYEGIWKPAVQCGREVKSYKVEAIEFVVGNNKHM